MMLSLKNIALAEFWKQNLSFEEKSRLYYEKFPHRIDDKDDYLPDDFGYRKKTLTYFHDSGRVTVNDDYTIDSNRVIERVDGGKVHAPYFVNDILVTHVREYGGLLYDYSISRAMLSTFFVLPSELTYIAIKNIALDLRQTPLKIIDTYNLNVNVRDTMTSGVDDQHRYYHLTRIATIFINDDLDVIIEYKRSHAFNRNEAPYIFNRKVKYFDEHMTITRSDKKTSENLKKVNDSIIFDTLTIYQCDFAELKKQIEIAEVEALKTRMMRFIL
ncbi:hypothetical protein PBCVNY2B_414L [Paramecium bursaria Chlorella virus NY2B]|nr:hypothetical protein PBCVIL52s1_423L [Paramecium bursaria Chlorella virus IL-5-2s1]AGE58341.1 hypothetical protein PBCVNY2B_414L [Paramecium bursaria Chlorella virus NY2B]